jgi:hypothetical protein
MKLRAISLSRMAGSCIPLVCFLLLAVVCAAVAQTQTGSQSTIVGTVKDASGAPVPGAKVTVVNTGTQSVSETTTNSEGNYMVPYLNAGTYRITAVANGFKQWIREGFAVRPSETPRYDATLEVGAVTENITVTGSAPLLETETAEVSTAMPQEVLTYINNVQKRIVRDFYYLPGVVGSGTSGYHVLGNVQRSIGYTMDGISAKWPGLGTFDQNDQVLQTTMDALEEVKVVTSGMSAEFGHAASGGMQLTYKSGANQVHGSFEDRHISTTMVHRNYFSQTGQQPFRYDEMEGTFSGPLWIPKVYNGRNKTFFLFGFARHMESWNTTNQQGVPTPAMLGGDFSFGGIGYPIYDPKSTQQVNGVWTRTQFANNIVPTNRFDPVAVKFLSYTPWQAPNDTLDAVTSPSGVSNNFLGYGVKPINRTRWDVKVDHDFSAKHKIAARYSQAHHRAAPNGATVAIAWEGLDTQRILQPTDVIQGVMTDTYIVSPTKFNEIRVGYSRRANQLLAWGVGGDWPKTLGIPGVPQTTFPQLQVGFGVTYNTPSYYEGDETTFQENFTQVLGSHNLKMGYELVRSKYNAANSALPSGSYNFGATCLPSGGSCTNNTGNGFAAFELGAVTSATFSQRFANWLPRGFQHSLYVQDDWKVRPGLTFNMGLRWSYETPFHTKYNQQSEFNPTVVDPLTGMMGAETHPTGYLTQSNWKNFQPRLGVAWKFAPRLVFRASFAVMTMDLGLGNGSQGSNFNEYQGTFNITQPTGDPRNQFYLSQGPALSQGAPVPIAYPVKADGTFPYIGSSYSSRNTTWLDPGLASPYIMNWSGGVQYEFAHNWLVEARYEGSSGNKLLGSWNVNEIPLSITLGGNTTLQNTVSGATQNYKPWTNFGSINMVSNFNHTTYHGGSIRLEKRMSNGLTVTAFDTYSKAMDATDGEGGGGITYYNRSLEKGIAGYNRQQHANLMVTYTLPFGRGQKFLNSGRIPDYIFGGWTISFNQTADSGMPFGVGFGNSPYKYLTGTRVVPLTSAADAQTPNWDIGPNRFPTQCPPQTPYLKYSSFAYPAAYTTGFLGRNVFRGPATYFQGFALLKTVTLKERYKFTVRLDGHNLPFKRPSFTTPNTTWTTAAGSLATFGSMSGTMGAWSEYGYNQATLQIGGRFEF